MDPLPTPAEMVHLVFARMHVPAFTRLFADAELNCTSISTRELSNDLSSVDAAWRMIGQVSLQGELLPPREGNMHPIAVHRDGGWLPLIVHNLDFSHTCAGVRGSDHPEALLPQGDGRR